MKKINRKGFTIVELVIVIAVIAILAGVLIPTFSGVVQRANSSAALQKATSVMKSSLAMSTTGTLADETIFAVGTKTGVSYEFKYKGNQIIENPLVNKAYPKLTAVGTTENPVLAYNRIIINDKMISSTGSFVTTDSDIVQSIIKDVFDASTITAAACSSNFFDSNAAYQCSITKDNTTSIIAVYVNSDYPVDVVTFVPATVSSGS